MRHNETLDGLRGAATLAVLAYHLHGCAVVGKLFDGIRFDSLAGIALDTIRLSVDVFFLISGFVIPAAISRARSMGGFLSNRAARIYPTFLVVHLLVFCAGPLIGYRFLAEVDALGWLQHFLSNLLFLPGLFFLEIAHGVTWTLSYEAAFYVFAASAVVLARSSLGPATVVGWMAWCFGAMLMLWHHPQSLFFVAGFACYLARSRIEVLLARQGLPALLLCLASFLTMYVALDDVPIVSAIGGMLFLSVFIAQQGSVCALLRRRAFLYLAKVSYSLYLWHPIVLFAVRWMFLRTRLLLDAPVACMLAYSLVSLALTLAVAHVAHELVERRLADWLARRSSSPRPVWAVELRPLAAA
jgi:peptidoglycan/LPS O-acetylase OafA/YrhL